MKSVRSKVGHRWSNHSLNHRRCSTLVLHGSTQQHPTVSHLPHTLNPIILLLHLQPTSLRLLLTNYQPLHPTFPVMSLVSELVTIMTS